MDNNGRSKDEQTEYTYSVAYATMVNACNKDEFTEASTLFQSISDYKDASILSEECLLKAKMIIYNDAINQSSQRNNIPSLLSAIDSFNNILDYMDSSEQINKCKDIIEKLIEKKEKRQKTKKIIKKFTLIASPIVIFCIATIIAVNYFVILPQKYENAMNLYNNKQYGEAGVALAELGKYKESKEHLKNALEYVRNSTPRAHAFSSAFNTTFIKSDGTVVAVGNKENGQCDLSDWADIIAVSSSLYHTVGLKSDGTVVAVGSNHYEQCDVSDWTDIVAISTGLYHTVGLKSDGTVVATGSNADGQCQISNWEGIISISVDFVTTIGLRADGTVIAAGHYYCYQYKYNQYECNQYDVSSWRDVISVSTSGQHTVGIKSDGTVVAVGDNRAGQCDVSKWTEIIEISVQGNRTIGLKADGTVVETGRDAFGEGKVSKWKGIISISSSSFHIVGLKSDGTVVAVGDNNEGECNVSDWTDIVNITTGYDKTFGVKSDGTVVFAGRDRFIQDDLPVINDINLN